MPDVDATGKLCPCPSGYACVAGRCAVGDAPEDASVAPGSDGAAPEAASSLDGGAVLWSADLETGDLSQWTSDGLGVANENDRAHTEVATTRARGGTHSMRLAVDGPTGSTFNRRWGVAGGRLPDDGFYGGWFYFPEVPTSVTYWAIMWWYSRLSPTDTRKTMVLSVPVSGGALKLELGDSITQTTLGRSATPLPTGAWVHIEVEVRQALDATGAVTVWQDGVEVISAQGIQTEIAAGQPDERRFSVASYVEDFVPKTADPDARAIYVDDLSIATTR